MYGGQLNQMEKMISEHILDRSVLEQVDLVVQVRVIGATGSRRGISHLTNVAALWLTCGRDSWVGPKFLVILSNLLVLASSYSK